MNPIIYQPIGVIHTPYTSPQGMPIQPRGAQGSRGHIDLNKDFVEGLKDVDGFSHLILIYSFHLAIEWSALVKPFMDNQLHGVFATRAPNRPNPVGLSIVTLERIENNRLYISNVDMLDGTPLIDIKPFIPQFDWIEGDVRIGWFSANISEVESKRSDARFIKSTSG